MHHLHFVHSSVVPTVSLTFPNLAGGQQERSALEAALSTDADALPHVLFSPTSTTEAV